MTTAHIISHTHWDREWFLTSVYTSRWIPGLVDRLVELVEADADFRFFLDGQTLVVEDLLQLAPEYREKVDRLVRGGNLLIGPYYCQPDWRLTAGEALLRNLLFGRQDMNRHGGYNNEHKEGTNGEARGGANNSGWLVDTFGHISQAPQIHRLFGILAVYIWRGAPKMEPYFNWEGADGSQTFTINLFGGYRNLYGVTRVPEIAAGRLLAELRRLQPYYPTRDIPLFDGYDLETNTEDPLPFYQNHRSELPPDVQVAGATPASFALELRQKLTDLPAIKGELMSGKYGAVFPGTLSARTYLKVMARDCEQLLYGVCEPLGAMASLCGRPYTQEQYQAWARGLLQNAVHDCICGVSIDQVHEKMEFSYRQIYEGLLEDLRRSLDAIFAGFTPGAYAVSTNPFPYEGWQVHREQLYRIQTNGVGVWKIDAGDRAQRNSLSIQNTDEAVETFTWANSHYEAQVRSDGTVQMQAEGAQLATLGRMLVYAERGDTYSSEIGGLLGVLTPSGPLRVLQKSELHCVLAADCSASWDGGRVSARLRLTFDQSPLIRWEIELDSRGTDFRADIIFETGHPGSVFAGMPFDVVQRPSADRDMLPRQLEKDLAAVLLGQRELGEVQTVPFHDFLAISDGSTSAVVLSKGLHAYQADENGRLTLTLRRSVEWLTRPDLEGRVGDAGPFFYVPDARCERSVTHELAFALMNCGPEDAQLQALNAGFQNPPLLVESHAGGTRTAWQFFQESLPLSSLHLADGRILARIFNPSSRPHRLSKPYPGADGFGRPQSAVEEVPPKGIMTLVVGEPPAGALPSMETRVDLVSALAWRVGPNQGLPDPAIIGQLKDKAKLLERRVEETAAALSQAAGRERYLLQHQVYVLQRELLEYRLSVHLNELKLAMGGKVTYDYLYEPDEEVAAIGRELNELRIQRRIYDYVIQAI